MSGHGVMTSQREQPPAVFSQTECQRPRFSDGDIDIGWWIVMKLPMHVGASIGYRVVQENWPGQVRSRSYDVIRGTASGQIFTKCVPKLCIFEYAVKCIKYVWIECFHVKMQYFEPLLTVFIAGQWSGAGKSVKCGGWCDAVSLINIRPLTFIGKIHRKHQRWCRIEWGIRWWRFEVNISHRFAAIVAQSCKSSIFRKIWPLTCHK